MDEDSGAASGLVVMVVDDNRDAADTCAQYLRKIGHSVHVAYDGPSALSLAANVLPRAVLLDIGMPVMTGYRVAEELRSNPVLPRPLIVAITAHGEAEARERSRQAGIHLHIVKPVDLAELATILQRYHDAGSV